MLLGKKYKYLIIHKSINKCKIHKKENQKTLHKQKRQKALYKGNYNNLGALMYLGVKIQVKGLPKYPLDQ